MKHKSNPLAIFEELVGFAYDVPPERAVFVLKEAAEAANQVKHLVTEIEWFEAENIYANAVFSLTSKRNGMQVYWI